MLNQEWSHIWHNVSLDVALLQASYVRHAYPRHSHDYYVISVIERGHQSFTHGGEKHFTSPGGVILINPGAAHTGEAADEKGFQMCCLYPTASHMESMVLELTGRHQGLPFFPEVRVDDSRTARSILTLHRLLSRETSNLEAETHFTFTLAALIRRHADLKFTEMPLGREQEAIQRARHYIEDCFPQSITLAQLAAEVSLSPYYFLRAFRADVGMPPHTYLESVRIGHAQRLIRQGKSLAAVAAEVGFSSQSHLTRCFKRIIGVTPGQYAHHRH